MLKEQPIDDIDSVQAHILDFMERTQALHNKVKKKNGIEITKGKRAKKRKIKQEEAPSPAVVQTTTAQKQPVAILPSNDKINYLMEPLAGNKSIHDFHPIVQITKSKKEVRIWMHHFLITFRWMSKLNLFLHQIETVMIFR